MDPRRWQIVGQGWFSPAAAACGERDIVLFARAASGELIHRRRQGDDWGPVITVGVPVAPGIPVEWPLSACSTGAGEVQLVARGAEGELLHATLRGEDWSGFECVGSPAGLDGAPMGLAGAPVVCSREPGKMEVFAVGSGGALLHATWDEAGFREFESLGGIERTGSASEPIPGAIAACNCGSRALAVLARGPTGDLLLKWWNGRIWSAFESLGAPQEPDQTYPAVRRAVPLASAPIACGGGAARLDIFARGPRGDLLHKWWDGKTWSGFESMGMPIAAETGTRLPFTGISMTAVRGSDRLDVLARAADGNLYAASSPGSF
jgi:Repeat of unknown function (DUF346)